MLVSKLEFKNIFEPVYFISICTTLFRIWKDDHFASYENEVIFKGSHFLQCIWPLYACKVSKLVGRDFKNIFELVY